MSDTEFQNIGELLERLPFLEKITLELSSDSTECNFVPGLKCVGEALREHEFLQEFNLILSGSISYGKCEFYEFQ